MPGVDLTGYAGFKDKVDRHWLQLAGGVILSSIMSAAVTSLQGSQTGFLQYFIMYFCIVFNSIH
jgi:type IV secretion system protein VirB10